MRERVSLKLKTKTSAYKRRKRVGTGVMKRCWLMSLIPLSYQLFVAVKKMRLHCMDWLPYAPEVEEPGWRQLEPRLNELPSNKRAHKDDRDEWEEFALKRPCPLNVDVEFQEPEIEVMQVKL